MNREDAWNMVLENQGLIYNRVNYFIGRVGTQWFSMQELRDELISVGYEAMLRAVETWDSAQATLSTYAYAILFNAFANHYRRMLATKGGSRSHGRPVGRIPQHVPLVTDHDEGGIRDELDDERFGVEEDFDGGVAVEQMLSVLSESEQNVIQRIVLGGENQVDVARDLGVSHQRVGQIKQRALAKMRKVVAE